MAVVGRGHPPVNTFEVAAKPLRMQDSLDRRKGDSRPEVRRSERCGEAASGREISLGRAVEPRPDVRARLVQRAGQTKVGQVSGVRGVTIGNHRLVPPTYAKMTTTDQPEPTVDFETLFESEDLRGLLEAAERTSSIKSAELVEILEEHALCPIAVDGIIRELEVGVPDRFIPCIHRASSRFT